MGNKAKKVLKTLLKISISGLALYFVFSKIKWSEVSVLLFSSNVFFLLCAILLFATSKLISAYRLQGFFKCIPLEISTRYNLKLYWIGMFYNLFLPGGVGGDGYKVYILNKQYGTGPKRLIQASLIDRISGLLSLLILVGIGVLFLDQSLIPSWIWYLDIIGLALAIPGFYLLTRLLFTPFTRYSIPSLLWSLGVQGLQVICAIAILYSMGVESQYLEYSILFLASSFVSILPFTIGGIGSRELTFLIGYQYLNTNEGTSIALSLFITLISALISFGGIFVKPEESKKNSATEDTLQQKGA